MSSSSRSIAAARSRRAGEQAPPISGGRPGTSIASQSAFVQQSQYQQPPPSQNMTNIRVSRGPPQQQQQQMPPQQQNKNNLPFSKLSISDAIGLITLRLGRVEQFMIDLDNNENENSNSNLGHNIPENTKLIDSSVLTTIIGRLDSLEKKESNSSTNEKITNLEKEIRGIKDTLFELISKTDNFMKDTNDKFIDYDCAITEIERCVLPSSSIVSEISNEMEQIKVDLISPIIDSETNNLIQDIPIN